MKALTLDDLLPLDEYAGRRREFFEAHGRYLDRYRRVRIGPRLTMVFENRQTLWFRLQEVLCIARLNQPSLVQQELDLDLRENRRVKSEEAAFLDLHRSSFFHRLRVLGVSFARPAPTTS